MPRLATCHLCRTLTRLPDPPASAPLVPARVAWMEDGREVEVTYRNDRGMPTMVHKWDPALEDWVARHAHDDIHIPDIEKWDLAYIDKLTWDATNIVKQIQTGLKDSHGVMYDERDQLKDDAMACFNEHHRPTDRCMDVFSESKVIGSHESQKGIKPNDRMFLCHLCPFVHGYVIPKVRHKKGYDR